MSAVNPYRLISLGLICWALALAGCDLPNHQPPAKTTPPQPPAATKDGQAAEVKRAELGKNVILETRGDQRRVLIQAEVCFREGLLELFLCKKNTKEHESVLSADIDARIVHAALEVAGAKAGSPVKFVPRYQPVTGSTIQITLEFEQNGTTTRVAAQQWVRDAKTRKELTQHWVFGGSQFFDHPDDPKQKLYAANGGDVICVSNFPDAMLDLPIPSSAENADLQFEAFTERIPPLGTKVTVILEPVPEKK